MTRNLPLTGRFKFQLLFSAAAIIFLSDSTKPTKATPQQQYTPYATPAPVLVPATSTARPPPRKEVLPPLKCETATNGGCYAFVPESMRFADAVSYCEKHGMYLASAAQNNIDLINRLATDNLSKNDTNPSRPCYERITMLANFDATRTSHYGTYSFTMGGGNCSTSATAGDDNGGGGGGEAFYEVCSKDADCTLVDWNVPNPFVCAKDDKLEPWCIEPIFSDNFYDYFVTCKSVSGTVSELRYPPMCLPFDYSDQLELYGDHVLKFKHINETKLISAIVLAPVGAITFCVPDIGCKKPDEASQFGLCRKEKNLDTTQLVQLWPRNTVGYRFAGWASSADKNLTAIRDTLSLIENSSEACFKFREIKDDSQYHGAVVQITPNSSPTGCSVESVGRKGGIQLIAYGGQCFNKEKSGLLMRPLLHQLGIPAEQNRFDRDQYITVNQDNIISDPAYSLQAIKQSIPGKLSLETPYDYDSVTHFPPNALAKRNTNPVFVAKNTTIKIGQRSHLSEGDKLKLRTLYGECKHA